MSENVPVLEVTPVIRGGFIVNLQVGSLREPLALRKPLPISELPNLYSLLVEINNYIDFQGQSGWTIDEAYPFLCNIISEKAYTFFTIIAKNKDWTSREKILKEMKIDGKTLAGVLSSPGQYFARYQKEALYEPNDRVDENKKLRRYYRIKPDFLDMVREILDIQTET